MLWKSESGASRWAAGGCRPQRVKGDADRRGGRRAHEVLLLADEANHARDTERPNEEFKREVEREVVDEANGVEAPKHVLSNKTHRSIHVLDKWFSVLPSRCVCTLQ